MDRNTPDGPDNARKEATNKASVLSVNEDAAPNTFRLSLQWQGNHSIVDFDLARFGKVLRFQDETENTGWAIVERSFHTPIARTLPGWAINAPIHPLHPGDTIPLRRDIE